MHSLRAHNTRQNATQRNATSHTVSPALHARRAQSFSLNTRRGDRKEEEEEEEEEEEQKKEKQRIETGSGSAGGARTENPSNAFPTPSSLLLLPSRS
eukprot:1353063-Rhodomonas_salina.1